ncbi:hypothetical protein P7K49_026059 [Saguinus oedipus]|uniref:Uncharacterized protein n=1 Tax=Saguinus oedipus TaxID=9490 RepID=A0ABQ9UIY0_SAGOE|nr:hypothetical protein P7K49_026059 [Saguinus oedipus]
MRNKAMIHKSKEESGAVRLCPALPHLMGSNLQLSGLFQATARPRPSHGVGSSTQRSNCVELEPVNGFYAPVGTRGRSKDAAPMPFPKAGQILLRRLGHSCQRPGLLWEQKLALPSPAQWWVASAIIEAADIAEPSPTVLTC